MTSRREVWPRDQELTMKAMLRSLLGDVDSGRLCSGMRLGGVSHDVLQIVVPAENYADHMLHSDDFAVAAEYAFGLPVRIVNIVLADRLALAAA